MSFKLLGSFIYYNVIAQYNSLQGIKVPLKRKDIDEDGDYEDKVFGCDISIFQIPKDDEGNYLCIYVIHILGSFIFVMLLQYNDFSLISKLSLI
jgi:hypothetical protein